MRKIIFPPVETATQDGLVALGGDLLEDTLITAYKQGIFPWPISAEYPLAWFSPDPRGILFLENLHIPKSFQKFLKRHDYQITFNQAFDEVISQCSKISRQHQTSTWITQDIIQGYIRLFKRELAYSVEVWSKEKLIAGLYGVCIGDFISGESMFTFEDNASKLALYGLVSHLKNKNIGWLDTQMVTPVVEHFGGIYISRPDFINLLATKNWTRKRDEIF
jgi:leucyl/phenylalanyl-tRNA--protein transferase